MTRLQMICLSALVSLASLAGGSSAHAQYATAVVSYNQGTFIPAGNNNQSAALGWPSRYTNDVFFPSVVSPFSSPFLPGQILSVGEGGHVTLKLSNYVIPQASGAPEIGVFENVNLNDPNWPSGIADSSSSVFGEDSAVVDVSADGITWVTLGSKLFDRPSNGYTDVTNPYSITPGSVLSDFQQPFTGQNVDFSNLPYYSAGGPDILEVLAGSGGGTWIDISSSGLPQVGYIRFSVLDDLNANSKLTLELDAVSISHAAQGSAVVPEPTTIILAALALLPLGLRWARRTLQRAAG